MCDVGYGLGDLTGIDGVIDEVVVALVNSRIYSPEHPRLRSTIDSIVKMLSEWPSEAIEILLVDGYLVHDGVPLRSSTLSSKRLTDLFERLDSGGLRLQRSTSAEELIEFLAIANLPEGRIEDWRDANTRLEAAGCSKLCFCEPKAASGGNAGEGQEHTPIEISMETYQGVLELLQGISIAVCRGANFRLDTVRGEVERIMKRLDDDPRSMLELSRYEQYDAFTFGHSVRVCILALLFAKSISDDPRLLELVGMSALMHDIGKAKVPFEIVHAPGRLTEEERREMEAHTIRGARTLLEIEDIDPVVVAAAFSHHKRLDAGGYPQTGFWAPRAPATRIVKICDVYEALTAVRPYKASMSPLRAYRIMMSMEKHFDLSLLRHFIQVNGAFPNGTGVLLSTGERADVLRQGPALSTPIVELTHDRDGEELFDEDRRVLELAGADGVSIEGPSAR